MKKLSILLVLAVVLLQTFVTPDARAEEHPAVKTGQTKWVYLGKLGDWPGGDTDCTDGRIPDTSLCTPNKNGTVAVCWEGRTQGHPFDRCRKFSTWCTYKNVKASSAPGGAAPGRVYECVASPTKVVSPTKEEIDSRKKALFDKIKLPDRKDHWYTHSGRRLGKWVTRSYRYGLTSEEVDDYRSTLGKKGEYAQAEKVLRLQRFLEYYEKFREWDLASQFRDNYQLVGDKKNEKLAQIRVNDMEFDMAILRNTMGKDNRLLKTMFVDAKSVNVLPMQFH